MPMPMPIPISIAMPSPSAITTTLTPTAATATIYAIAQLTNINRLIRDWPLYGKQYATYYH